LPLGVLPPPLGTEGGGDEPPSVEPPEDGGVEPPEDGGVEPPEDGGVEPPEDGVPLP
jgi:hypothetical protein